ncbi:MAG: DNA polymerase III subunit gamma/tau [Clostridia bacterium]|nr:DNA polymerase III subunit gamma/tau [Clostridia bacterium]
MSYQALYRAWRPETFSDMCGQDAITRTLKRQVMTGRIAHAYLFCGTRGTGKTTAAKVLSRAVNCLNPKDGDPCGVCEICKALLQETCMDVVEIDAASNNGVDEIRDLREKIKYPPSLTRYKVYIIDEVHMLSTGAFNALLKTLEEPPAHALFILATTEPQRLPATILSRCQRFDFHRISSEVIVRRLEVVLDGIGRSAEREALEEIARAAEGAMRDALSLLDVCLSYTDGTVTGQLARDVMGTAGRAAMFEFTDALIDGDAGRALMEIDRAMRAGSDPQVFIRDTIAHLRGIMLAGAVGGDLAELMEITPEDAQRMTAQSGRIGVSALERMVDLFIRAEPDVRWVSRPRTLLELSAVRACHPEKEEDSGVSERLERVEKLLEGGAIPQRIKASSAPGAEMAEKEEKKKTEPTVNRAEGPASTLPQQAPPQAYLDAIARLQQSEPSLKKPLTLMHFVSFEGDRVRVEFKVKEANIKMMLERKSKLIEAALTESFGRPVSISMDLEGRAPEKKVSDTARKVIDQAYDIFGREKISIEDR